VPVAHVYNPTYPEGRDQKVHCLKPAWENSLWEPFSKKPTQKRTGGVAQVIENLPSKHEVLRANPSITKKKKRLVLSG
jgi:hypothetical protein